MGSATDNRCIFAAAMNCVIATQRIIVTVNWRGVSPRTVHHDWTKCSHNCFCILTDLQQTQTQCKPRSNCERGAYLGICTCWTSDSWWVPVQCNGPIKTGRCCVVLCEEWRKYFSIHMSVNLNQTRLLLG